MSLRKSLKSHMSWRAERANSYRTYQACVKMCSWKSKMKNQVQGHIYVYKQEIKNMYVLTYIQIWRETHKSKCLSSWVQGKAWAKGGQRVGSGEIGGGRDGRAADERGAGNKLVNVVRIAKARHRLILCQHRARACYSVTLHGQINIICRFLGVPGPPNPGNQCFSFAKNKRQFMNSNT